MSPMISPKYSSGITTSTFMIGSKITGLHFLAASLRANDAATLNAISDESTSWYDPSNNLALTSINSYPANTPFAIESFNPASTAGMYSRGTTPPTIAFSNSNPAPGSFGVNSIHTSPYCPRPPD